MEIKLSYKVYGEVLAVKTWGHRIYIPGFNFDFAVHLARFHDGRLTDDRRYVLSELTTGKYIGEGPTIRQAILDFKYNARLSGGIERLKFMLNIIPKVDSLPSFN